MPPPVYNRVNQRYSCWLLVKDIAWYWNLTQG